MVDGYFGRRRRPGERRAGRRSRRSPLRRGNFMARMRMAVLYDRSVTWRGLVVGTGNKTESLIGYTTLFGDSACAFNPIGDLYKSQVRQLSAAIGVPEAIIRKAPSADLWPGQTDETEAGFSYPELDRLLFWRIDKRRIVGRAGRQGVRPRRWSSGWTGWSRARSSSARCRRSRSSGPRTAGVDYLYPRRRPGLGAALTVAGRPGRALAATLYVVATPIGNLGDVTLRALEVLRAVPLIAAEDTRITRRLLDRYEIATRTVSYHAQSGPARERGAARAPRGRRGPRAGHRRRHARRLAIRARGWWRPGPPPGAPSWRSPAPRRCWRPSRPRRGRPALVVRGVPAAERARAAGAAGADRGRRARRPSCSRRPAGSAATLATSPRPAARTGPAPSAASSRSCTSRSSAGRSASWPSAAAGRRRSRRAASS